MKEANPSRAVLGALYDDFTQQRFITQLFVPT